MIDDKPVLSCLLEECNYGSWKLFQFQEDNWGPMIPQRLGHILSDALPGVLMFVLVILFLFSCLDIYFQLVLCILTFSHYPLHNADGKNTYRSVSAWNYHSSYVIHVSLMHLYYFYHTLQWAGLEEIIQTLALTVSLLHLGSQARERLLCINVWQFSIFYFLQVFVFYGNANDINYVFLGLWLLHYIHRWVLLFIELVFCSFVCFQNQVSKYVFSFCLQFCLFLVSCV